MDTIPATPVQLRASDASPSRLIQPGQVSLVGAFRLDTTTLTEFAYAGGNGAHTIPLAWHASTGGLFIGCAPRPEIPTAFVAEIKPPDTLGDPSNIPALPVAATLQLARDPLEGHLLDFNNGDPGNGLSLDGLLVIGEQLIGNVYLFYDVTGVQERALFTRGVNLTASSFRGPYAVTGPSTTQHVSGPLASVPPAWKGLLKGDLLLSQFGITGFAMTSGGPDAWAIRSADIQDPTRPISSVPVLDYPYDHLTLCQPPPASGDLWAGIWPFYGGVDSPAGLCIPTGWDSLLYVVLHGTGLNPYSPGFQYGPSTDDPAVANTPVPNTDFVYVYDPALGGQGPHAYPYVHRILAYDLSELKEVAGGNRDPWVPIPYAAWDLPSLPGDANGGGVAIDPVTNRIYVSQGDRDYPDNGQAPWPIVYVFEVR